MLRYDPAVDVRELLAEADLFRTFDAPALDVVVAAARQRSLRRNDVVFEEGQGADSMYVVEVGRIAITSASGDGRESVFALMEPGDLFGEMGLFDETGRGRSAQGRALENTDLIEVPYQPVQDLLDRRPELLWGVVQLLVDRLRSTDAALADSVFLDVTGRTAKRLLELAGDHDEFVLPVTQEELAGMVGASRERVNKALAAFLRLGWLEQTDRRYKITDREQLTRRAH